MLNNQSFLRAEEFSIIENGQVDLHDHIHLQIQVHLTLPGRHPRDSAPKKEAVAGP